MIEKLVLGGTGTGDLLILTPQPDELTSAPSRHAFSCKLSKTDLMQPHFGTFPEGSALLQGVDSSGRLRFWRFETIVGSPIPR